MPPRKSAANGSAIGVDAAPAGSSGDRRALAAASVPVSSLASDPLPAVKVNNANLGEIKSALDDIVKKVCRRLSIDDP
jgi:hypothetical protein